MIVQIMQCNKAKIVFLFLGAQSKNGQSCQKKYESAMHLLQVAEDLLQIVQCPPLLIIKNIKRFFINYVKNFNFQRAY